MWFVWWFAAALALGIVEVLTVDLIFLMIAIGALCAGIVSAAGLGLLWQMVVFVLVSLIMLAVVRPWAKAHLMKTTPDISTNAQGLVGRDALTLTRMGPEEGRIRLEGEVWTARSAADQPIPPGVRVHVTAIDGATAIVTAQPDPSDPYSTSTGA